MLYAVPINYFSIMRLIQPQQTKNLSQSLLNFPLKNRENHIEIGSLKMWDVGELVEK